MTIKKLKELIADLPDDARIYLDDGDSILEGNSEIIEVTNFAKSYDKKVLVRTRHDIDVSAFLEDWQRYYAEFEEEVDEYDMFLELGELGFNLEDFNYDEEVYEWAKEFSKTHAWYPNQPEFDDN